MKLTKRQEQNEEALRRARTGASANDAAVVAAFALRGIHATPREDVYTYRAWQAAGRQVRKGERGVSIVVWVPRPPTKAELARNPKASGSLMPKGVTVFHVSQTDAQEPHQ